MFALSMNAWRQLVKVQFVVWTAFRDRQLLIGYAYRLGALQSLEWKEEKSDA
jgi:hypothetical protein